MVVVGSTSTTSRVPSVNFRVSLKSFLTLSIQQNIIILPGVCANTKVRIVGSHSIIFSLSHCLNIYNSPFITNFLSSGPWYISSLPSSWTITFDIDWTVTVFISDYFALLSSAFF